MDQMIQQKALFCLRSVIVEGPCAAPLADGVPCPDRVAVDCVTACDLYLDAAMMRDQPNPIAVDKLHLVADRARHIERVAGMDLA